MKNFFIIIFIFLSTCLYARTVYNGTNLDFDLLMIKGQPADNLMRFAPIIVNYSTFTAQVSDFRVIGWLRSTTYTASNFVKGSFAERYYVYN
ncbi:MAG: hypothetical protein ACUVQP_08030, partial [Bacteroidales bacterium]